MGETGEPPQNGDASNERSLDTFFVADLERRLAQSFKQVGDSVVERLEGRLAAAITRAEADGCSRTSPACNATQQPVGWPSTLLSPEERTSTKLLEPQSGTRESGTQAPAQVPGTLPPLALGPQIGTRENGTQAPAQVPGTLPPHALGPQSGIRPENGPASTHAEDWIREVLPGGDDTQKMDALAKDLLDHWRMTENSSIKNPLAKSMTLASNSNTAPSLSTLAESLTRRLPRRVGESADGPRRWSAEHIPKTRFNKIVLNSKFEMASTFVIMANGVLAWYGTDQQRVSEDGSLPKWMQRAEQAFLCIYWIEFLIKLFVYRVSFFCNEDWKWNLFDCLVCLQGMYDELTAAFLFEHSASSITYMRLLRLFKLGKVFRMFRAFRVIRELRVMFHSVVDSMVSMFWSIIMLVFFMYIFALVFMQGINAALHGEDAPDISDEERRNLDTYFQSTLDAMLSLYMATSGGTDWELFFNLLGVGGVTYQVIFLMYVVFTTFALFNILTGILVDKVSSQALTDREDMFLEWRLRKMGDIKELKALCHSIDSDGDGKISWDELQSHFKSDQVIAYLDSMDLRIHDAELFFTVLQQICGNDDIDIDMFVEGCMKMKGPASGIDQHALAFQLKLLRESQACFEKMATVHLGKLSTLAKQQLEAAFSASDSLAAIGQEQFGTQSTFFQMAQRDPAALEASPKAAPQTWQESCSQEVRVQL